MDIKKESLKVFLARRNAAEPLQVCRIRSVLWKKEAPPILSEGRKEEDRFFEPKENPWLVLGDCTPWENEEGIVCDGKYESQYSFCFYLPDGELVWGVSVDFDFESIKAMGLIKNTYAGIL